MRSPRRMLASSGLFRQVWVFAHLYLTAFSAVSQRSCRIGDCSAGHELAHVPHLIDCAAFDETEREAGQTICGHVLVWQKDRSKAGASQQKRHCSFASLLSLSHFIPPLNKQAIAATQAEIEVPFMNIPAHRLIFIFITLCVPDSRQTSRCRTFALPCRQNICGVHGLVFAKFECTACWWSILSIRNFRLFLLILIDPIFRSQWSVFMSLPMCPLALACCNSALIFLSFLRCRY